MRGMSKLFRRPQAGDADARRIHWRTVPARFLWLVLAIVFWQTAYNLGGGNFAQGAAFYGWLCLVPVLYIAWIVWVSKPPKCRG